MRLHVAQLLRYLGFTLNDLEERTVVVQRSGPDRAYLTADMTAAQQSPVPQYGSLHSGTFDLVCLWERPETEVIGSRLHNLKLRANHVLVFYLGRLTSKRRLSLMNYMRQQALSMLMLDEYLLLFLLVNHHACLPSSAAPFRLPPSTPTLKPVLWHAGSLKAGPAN